MRPVWEKLHDGSRCVFKREESNAYEKNAIMVIHEGFDVGYIERKAASVLAPMLDMKKLVLRGYRKLNLFNVLFSCMN